jgi:hypothetical protein
MDEQDKDFNIIACRGCRTKPCRYFLWDREANPILVLSEDIGKPDCIFVANKLLGKFELSSIPKHAIEQTIANFRSKTRLEPFQTYSWKSPDMDSENGNRQEFLRLVEYGEIKIFHPPISQKQFERFKEWFEESEKLKQYTWLPPASEIDFGDFVELSLTDSKFEPGEKKVTPKTEVKMPHASKKEETKVSQKWTEDEIKAEWKKTEAGKKIIEKLPSSTKFKSYTRKPGDKRNAYYSPKDNTIYIPNDYNSREAAPTAAHEVVHADQVINKGRPKDSMDKIKMEVEAKNAGLNVYDQMGKPSLPYNYKSESEFRERDPEGYNEAVRKAYKKRYSIK